MTYDILEVSWIAGGLFFGIGEALVAGIISFVPQDKDDLISYYLSMPKILPPIFIFLALALGTPIFFTWIHCVNECSIIWYIFTSIITILAIILCVFSYRWVMGSIVQTRLLSLVRITLKPEEPK